MCSINSGWLKETFWHYATIDSWVIDKYNTMFHNVKECFIRIKPILKFHKDCNFAGQFLIHFFPAYTFAINFGKPKDSLISERTQIDSYQL